MNVSRRSFVAALGAAVLFASGCATSSSVGTGASFKGPIGLQLYSLRGLFTKSVPQGLALTKSYGIKEVELAGTYGMPPEKLKAMLDEHGLNPVAGHFSFDKLRDDPEGVAKEAKALGLKYAGSAWIPHQGAFDEAQAKAAAATLNKAGEVFAKYGIKVYYHCHGFEFQPGVIPGGRKAMEILLTETNPKVVDFQMDILWITFPGEDAAEWLTKYPGRWVSLHMKDLKKGVKTGSHVGGTDPNNDVVLGTGQMNWPKILAAAKKSGVKYYFIEDESADAANQIPRSLKFLEQVKF
jgi:sugar phosphate isomerase/epimerase